MQIPKKIKIGSHYFEITLTKTNDGERGSSNWGKTDFLNGKILIDKEVCPSQIEETFFHECLHCLFNESKIGRDLDDKEKRLNEEDIVHRLSPVLVNFLKDNNLIK